MNFFKEAGLRFSGLSFFVSGVWDLGSWKGSRNGGLEGGDVLLQRNPGQWRKQGLGYYYEARFGLLLQERHIWEW